MVKSRTAKSFRIDLKSKYTGRLEETIIPSKNYIDSYNNFNLRNVVNIAGQTKFKML